MRRHVEVKMYDRPTIDLDIFIVPNKAQKVSGKRFVEDGFYGRIESVFNKNGMGMDLDDWLIQIWFANADCDNWEDHYPVTQLDGEEYHVRFASYDIPYSICKEWKEGESVSIAMPVELVSVNDPNRRKKDIWTLRVTPRQQKYRYKSFGAFEIARTKVIW